MISSIKSRRNIMNKKYCSYTLVNQQVISQLKSVENEDVITQSGAVAVIDYVR